MNDLVKLGERTYVLKSPVNVGFFLLDDKEVVLKETNIDNLKVVLIKYGAYYKLQLTLVLNSNLTLREATQIEKSVKKHILQHRSLHIKYVTIFITDEI